MEKNYKLHEAVADIALVIGGMIKGKDEYDSRLLVRNIVEWAKEFEEKHKDVDWDTHTEDYMLSIERFAENKWKSERMLEKKERKEWDYPREFKKSERVVYEDKHGTPHKAMVTCDQQSKYEDDEIEIFIFHDEEDDDSQGIEMKFVDVKGVYQLNEKGKRCPRCGEPLCDEHLEHMDYPYYCPWCQENFYGIEVQ